MKRQRMWMEVGVWPPPVRAQWQPARSTVVRRRRWIVAGVVASVVLGAVVGSIATLMLVGTVAS